METTRQCLWVMRHWTSPLLSFVKATWFMLSTRWEFHLIGGVFVHEEENRVCSKYDMCVIPLHECMFSLIGLCLSFNNFEVRVLNLLLISTQLHPVSWGYVKIFQ